MPTTILTLAQQREAEAQDRDRRDLEAALLLALLAFAARARFAAIHSARLGYDPAFAVRAVLLGNAQINQPGILPTIQRHMFRAFQTGKRRVVNEALSRARGDLPWRDELLERMSNPAADAATVKAYLPDLYNRAHNVARAFAEALATYFALPARTAVIEAFKSIGLWPEPVTPGNWAARNIADTAVGLAYNAGQGRALNFPALRQKIWGLTWRTMRDDRVRPTHRLMEGVTRKLDDPVWELWVPPAGHNCRCVRVIRFELENPRETAVPDVWPDEGFAGRGNVSLREFA
jgi:SPP1 gp7 family putative phage head morphogenesis protein